MRPPLSLVSPGGQGEPRNHTGRTTPYEPYQVISGNRDGIFKETAHETFGGALMEERRRRKEFPTAITFVVNLYRTDLIWPDGLTEDEREALYG